MTDYSDYIDPALALELLPEKIRICKRQISSIALDLSILETLTERDQGEVEMLEKAFRVQKAALVAYEKRLKAIQEAASGQTEEKVE